MAVLALAYFTTTCEAVDCGYPPGMFRMTLRDSDGKPVEGAVFRIDRAGTRTPAYRTPLENHIAEQNLVSDATGQLAAYHTFNGIDFGGTVWHVFGAFHFGFHTPQFDCEITADGFKPYRFSVWRLFDAADDHFRDAPKATLKTGDRETELPEAALSRQCRLAQCPSESGAPTLEWKFTAEDRRRTPEPVPVFHAMSSAGVC